MPAVKKTKMFPDKKMLKRLKEIGSLLIKRPSFTITKNRSAQYPKLSWLKKESASPPKKARYRLSLPSTAKLLAIKQTKTKLTPKKALCRKAKKIIISKNIFIILESD